METNEGRVLGNCISRSSILATLPPSADDGTILKAKKVLFKS